VAQSGHELVRRKCPLSGGKAGIDRDRSAALEKYRLSRTISVLIGTALPRTLKPKLDEQSDNPARRSFTPSVGTLIRRRQATTGSWRLQLVESANEPERTLHLAEELSKRRRRA
jgi:hypothetical protein